MARHISYLSDPKGKLTIQSNHKLQQYQQGSEQASFLACNNCDTVVAVVCKIDSVNRGAINATLLNDFQKMKKPQSVSPKSLSTENKLERWNSLWLTVELDYTFNI